MSEKPPKGWVFVFMPLVRTNIEMRINIDRQPAACPKTFANHISARKRNIAFTSPNTISRLPLTATHFQLLVKILQRFSQVFLETVIFRRSKILLFPEICQFIKFLMNISESNFFIFLETENYDVGISKSSFSVEILLPQRRILGSFFFANNSRIGRLNRKFRS